MGRRLKVSIDGIPTRLSDREHTWPTDKFKLVNPNLNSTQLSKNDGGLPLECPIISILSGKEFKLGSVVVKQLPKINSSGRCRYWISWKRNTKKLFQHQGYLILEYWQSSDPQASIHHLTWALLNLPLLSLSQGKKHTGRFFMGTSVPFAKQTG